MDVASVLDSEDKLDPSSDENKKKDKVEHDETNITTSSNPQDPKQSNETKEQQPATTTPPQQQQSQPPPPPQKQESHQQTSYPDLSDDVPTCRICHCTDSSDLLSPNKLISPCLCSGSLKWVHHNCLQQWLSATNSQRCELCKYQFSMTVKYKPFHKWGMNSSVSARRKFFCNSVFNLVSMICVFWSIYVLIERASLDARYGQIDWSFWTKMCVITIGFIGGIIFVFVQLRFYFSIFIRWRQSNRIIIIRNANLTNNNTVTIPID